MDEQKGNMGDQINKLTEQNSNLKEEISSIEEQNINATGEENNIEDPNSNMIEENNMKENVKRRKLIKWGIISLSSLLIIYLSISVYFMSHFYFGSAINSISVAGKTVEEVNEEMAAEVENYTLVLEERGGQKEEISSADIGLMYNSHDKVQEFKNNQHPLGWISGLFSKTEFEMSELVLYNDELLRESLNKLSCFNSNNIIEPKNASIKYTNKGYEIVEEVEGNKINKDILYDHVVKAVLNEETTINLDSINCYERPQYTSDSNEIINAKNLLNKYVSATITYTFSQGEEVLDRSAINTWLKVDEKFQVTFNEEKVRNYINSLARNYDTLGSSINFVTSLGKTVKVSGGDYGLSINKSKEVQDLIRVIKEGKATTKKPIYTQTAPPTGINDIGSTYVEIDLTNQYIWFYKNGTLIVEGNVVTGNVSSNHTTPAGAYKLAYKQKNAILRGPGYAAPVSYWMPFNGDIGIHDATWRSAFGGNIYKTDGSHGCINTPYKVAEAIFNNIEAGMPVICYN
ncbi:peptidoglycan binding domain-containing protein [Clostridium sp.]|uniref:L,D-transpeptidase family protein n=1 Tax=Clostridium sp. TaxID=1506 RepID=UPI002FC96CCD